MKRKTFLLLTLLMMILSLSFALSENVDACGQTVELISPDKPLDTLLSSLPDTGAVIQTREDLNGVTYVLVLYPPTVFAGCSGSIQQQAADGALTAKELLNFMNWMESQVKTQAAEGARHEECFDPAVYQTAQPSAVPTVDPAVFWTAQPSAASTVDPAVYQTARPSAVTTVNLRTSLPARPVPTAARTLQTTARPTSRPIVSTGDYTTFDSTMQEQKLLNLLNEDRARYGLPPLTLDPELSRLAQLKASDMNSNHYFAHESPTYGNASQMLDAFQYDYQGVGENIAHHANVEKAEAAFMSSDGHRRNILGSQWDKVGIGVVYDENGNVYVTQLFAR